MPTNSTVRLTVAQAIVRYLSVQYSVRDGQSQRFVPGILGLFGHGNSGGFAQALDESRETMYFIEGRNEQGMAHIAAGYAKAARRESVLACTTSIGPGSTNMISAAAGAYINRLPMLLFPADMYASRRQGAILQGLEVPSGGDITANDCFRPVSRYFDRIVRPEQLLDVMPRAMRMLTDAVDCGPAVIALPQDVQTEAFDFPIEFFRERDWVILRQRADEKSLDDAMDAIAASTRPLIVAGGGVLYSRAEEQLLSFAENAQIPIAETLGGKGSVRTPTALILGGLGVAGTSVANHVAHDADLVICVGTRLADYVTASKSVFQNPDVTFIGMNVDRADATKFRALSVVGDARESLTALQERLTAMKTPSRTAYLDEIKSYAASWNEVREDAFAPDSAPPLRQTEIIGVLNREMNPEDVLVTSAGTLPGDVFRYWDSASGPACHIEFGNSCMGYDIAAAIGVGLTLDNGEVFALLGDGTLLLSPSDLAVAVQHRRKITVVVPDNQGMRSIRGLEKRTVGDPYANIFDFRDPFTYELGDPVKFDLEAIGRGFGMRTFSVETRSELESALKVARKSTISCLVVIQSDVERAPVFDSPWWDISPAEVSSSDGVKALRDIYEEKRQLQRWYL
jgi:3D-(3,5/4)-trihydroxycyclohexane-1,2-dione acylhydrolase (decyclizing)